MIFRLKNEKRFRITACVIGTLVLFVVLFSSFYIAVEADHECAGEHCSVCECIEQCETTLHHLAGCGAAVLITAAAAVFILRLSVCIRMILRKKTPVSMRIRLNN